MPMPNKTAPARVQVTLQSKSCMPMEEAAAGLIAGGIDRVIAIVATAGVAEVVLIETSAIITIGRTTKIPGRPPTDISKYHVIIQVQRKMMVVKMNNKNKKTKIRIIMPQTPNKKLNKEPLMMKNFKSHINQIKSKKNLRKNTKMMELKCPKMTKIEIIKIKMIAEITDMRGIEATASTMHTIKTVAIRTTKEMIKKALIRIIEITEVAGIKRTTMPPILVQISDNTIKMTPNSTRLS